MAKKKNKKRSRNIIILCLLLLLAIAGMIIWPTYQWAYAPNVVITNGEGKKYFYIHTGKTFSDVIETFEKNHLLRDTSSFRWLAMRMKYPALVKAGKYQLRNGMSNIALIRMLRLGQQVPVDIALQKIRFKEDVAGLAGRLLETDSIDIIRKMNNSHFLAQYGLNENNAMSLFLANTYRFKWNTSSDEFFKRMKEEWDKIWTQERKDKASALSINPQEVMTLASIVQEETIRKDEAPTIAGVYLNRLKINMPLQADPTLKYIKLQGKRNAIVLRLYNKDKTAESAYNTYMVKGLPPGPIIVPELWAIDAVLNVQKHDYLFFVARGDGSGYSHFSKTDKEHEEYSRQYHQSLDARGIR